MINELYDLYNAMEKAGVRCNSMAPNLSSLPKNRCFCVRIDQSKISSIIEVPDDKKETIFKYGGTSAGSYPYVNLASLYRVTDGDIIKKINALKKKPEKISNYSIDEIRAWCSENNWDNKVINRFTHAFTDIPGKLKRLMGDNPYEPLALLMKITSDFTVDSMYTALETYAFDLLNDRVNVELALTILFNTKIKADDAGSLAFLFDSLELYNSGVSAASVKFSSEWNNYLLSTGSNGSSSDSELDAFGQMYTSMDDPMPEVKLGIGFNAKIRTMNPDVPCQARHGMKGSLSYPASVNTRNNLSAALNFIGNNDNKLKTWMCISTKKVKNKEIPQDIMFVYPSELKSVPDKFATMFSRPNDPSIQFLSQAQSFLSQLHLPKKPGTDSKASFINIFIIRRLDVQNNSGRTKVLYTRQINPYELERYSEEWTLGCSENLPKFPFGQPDVPFPLESADILNCFFYRNGDLIPENFKPTPKYHGMELFLEPNAQIQADLHRLVQNGINLAALLGKKAAANDFSDPIYGKAKGQIALIGLLLYRANIRKECYMENFPYLYGRLLKVSDSLHVLYCKVVRKGDIPTQLVGGSLFQAATEAPIRTLSILGQRINPYILWAKSYQYKEINEPEKERKLARWLLSMYEEIAAQLSQVWSNDTRLNEIGRAHV